MLWNSDSPESRIAGDKLVIWLTAKFFKSTYSGKFRKEMGMESEVTLDCWSTRDELNAVFVGHTVVAVDGDQLLLDDGTELEVVPNEGGMCGCGAYAITELNDCDNVITGCKIVETVYPPDQYSGERHTYRLFVFSGHQKVNMLTIDGDDGTGIYGTGFVIYVKLTQESKGNE